MRKKKALINSIMNIITFFIAFIPNLLVRKVFIQYLGNNLLGLNSLFSNIIGWLSIFELGIGSAIVYSLYRPFEEKDYDKVSAYITYFGKIYKCIGVIILCIGIAILPFLNFFINSEVNIKIAQIGFFLFLINSVISYFFSHKICILNVAQEAYKISIGSSVSKLFIALFQIVMMKIYPSFILYIIIQIIVNCIYYMIINLYINKRFEFLVKSNYHLDNFSKKNLLINIKALFMHKIGNLVVNSTDNILVSKFIGLNILGKYSNYQLVISAVQSIINNALFGLTASIGSMLVEGDKNKSYRIHKNIFFLSFWINSFIVISLYNTLNQFVVLWVGESNSIDKLTFNIILLNLYFYLMRGSVDQFQAGSGTFHQDRFAPVCEAILNFVSSIILVKYMGIAGVFMGTLISNFFVIFWTKPYIVYKYVFQISVIEYFKMYFKYMIIGLLNLIITSMSTVYFKNSASSISFMINCLINIIVINGIYYIIFRKSSEFNYLIELINSLKLRNKRSD